MTITDLIILLAEHDPKRVVYVGTKDAIAKAATVEDDMFDAEVGPAVLIECGDEQ